MAGFGGDDDGGNNAPNQAHNNAHYNALSGDGRDQRLIEPANQPNNQ